MHFICVCVCGLDVLQINVKDSSIHRKSEYINYHLN